MGKRRKTQRATTKLGNKGLELAMRDVLSGMAELASISAFTPEPVCLEFVKTVRSEPQQRKADPAQVIPHPALRNTVPSHPDKTGGDTQPVVPPDRLGKNPRCH